METCRRCGAEVLLALGPTDLRVALDPEPGPRGTLALTPKGRAVWPREEPDAPRRALHATTCPANHRPAGDLCGRCRNALDPLLAAAGEDTHPSCDPEFRPRPDPLRLRTVASSRLDDPWLAKAFRRKGMR